MSIRDGLHRIKREFGSIHAYGKATVIGVFLTHGVIDYLTTITAYAVAESRGLNFADVEKNPFVAGSTPFEIFLIVVGSAFVISLVCAISYRIIEKEGGMYNRIFADFLFTVLVLMGAYININNLIFLSEFV